MEYTDPNLSTAVAAKAINRRVECELQPGVWVQATVKDYAPSFGHARWSIRLKGATGDILVDGSKLRAVEKAKP